MGGLRIRRSSAFRARPGSRAWRRVLTALVLISTGGRAWAHDERVSASDVRISKHELIWTVDVGLLGLEKVVGLQEFSQGERLTIGGAKQASLGET